MLGKRRGGTARGELAAVNGEVNRKLGADFQRLFATATVRQRLRQLDVPVLLVHGDADPRPVAAGQALAAECSRAGSSSSPASPTSPTGRRPTRCDASYASFSIRSADRGAVPVPQRSTITAMSERYRTPDIAGRLWFTGPDGPYTPEQWNAIRRLLLACANRWAKALYGCKTQPLHE
jgi:hypothetical protein